MLSNFVPIYQKIILKSLKEIEDIKTLYCIGNYSSEYGNSIRHYRRNIHSDFINCDVPFPEELCAHGHFKNSQVDTAKYVLKHEENEIKQMKYLKYFCQYFFGLGK